MQQGIENSDQFGLAAIATERIAHTQRAAAHAQGAARHRGFTQIEGVAGSPYASSKHDHARLRRPDVLKAQHVAHQNQGFFKLGPGGAGKHAQPLPARRIVGVRSVVCHTDV